MSAVARFRQIAISAFAIALCGTTARANTYTVTNTNDSGAGSLRQAILDANGNPGLDEIDFDIPGSGVHTITPATELPHITDPVVINGYSQLGSSPNTLAVGDDAVLEIELDGGGAGFYGLTLTGGGSTIKGLAIGGWGFNTVAIAITGGGGNTVSGCFIGTDPTGSVAHANFGGIGITSDDNTIGGPTPDRRNVISGGTSGGFYSAIIIQSAGNVVQGNYIGTDATGTVAIPNGQAIFVIGAANNTIGGLATPPGTPPGNVISGNNGGLEISGGTATGNVVQGNIIGLNATGTASLPVASIGLAIGPNGGANNNLIGGTAAGARNVISGNTSYGIYVASGYVASFANTIQGNIIGPDITGTVALSPNQTGIFFNGGGPNQIGGSTPGAGNLISGNGAAGGNNWPGVALWAGAPGNVFQGNLIGTQADGVSPLGNAGAGIGASGSASQNVIGGIGPGEGNVIAFNGNPTVNSGGVQIQDTGTVGNAVRGNSIHDNGGAAGYGLGIDLNSDGVTANDSGDGDAGSNGTQNFPIVSSVTNLAPVSGTRIQGVLHSSPSTTYDLDFYANPACSNFPREYLEGETYIGSGQVTTDGSGTGAFDVTVAASVEPGARITATATDPGGNTSEFSQRLPFSISPTSGPAATATPVTIAGTDFLPGATVKIAGQLAGNVVVVNFNSITATTPALAAGTVNDVLVTNTDGSSGTLVKGFVSDFLDVPASHQFYAYVTTLVSNAVTVGLGDGTYGVNDDTERQQMSALILKAKHGLCYTPPPCTGHFVDVPCASSFAPWIEEMATEGITAGCDATHFCPSDPVTRDQMAVFLLKAEHGSSYKPPACAGKFGDVPCPSQFANWIEQLANESITGGCGNGNYCPSQANSRGQMAVFLVKTFALQ